ncbi:hypothetical protein [Tateyamaria sp. ANG-S1]|uniref:hypothetical protein n=1 Tax=Tateyamaria sp. ANG-S1 TaxID=1577905 RepID=UPI001269B427|nr:hypothetical protein [Tateyamaria sp. ANG-S1]
MTVHDLALQTDDMFEFKTGPIASTTAFDAALQARGIDTSTLTHAQNKAFVDAAMQIDKVLASDVSTVEEARDLLAFDADIEAVDNLSTLNGERLNGVATEDGKIILDSALTGQALRDTLIEELAESAFYEAFNRSSAGDFGAETEARIEGNASAEYLAQLSTDVTNDTVQTEFGNGQASSIEKNYAYIFDLVMQDVQRELASQKNAFTDMLVAQGGQVMSGQGGQIMLQNLYSKVGLISYSETSGIDYSTSMKISNTANLDLNGDGIADTYEYLGFSPHFAAQSHTGTKLENVGFVPTSKSAKFLMGAGDSKTTWVAKKDETISTAETVSVNNKVELRADVSISGKVFGAGLELKLGASQSTDTGQSSTTTSAFSFGSEVRQEHTVTAGSYEKGTLISYGMHAVKGDLTYNEELTHSYKITNAAAGKANHFDVTQTAEVTQNDYLLDVVMTDYDVNNPPTINSYDYLV